ncbi:type IV pilin protein [Roseateles sp. BYS180W]|uniref:Type IV pilin protein n=1 Tax=Roseateles rivi TaxID=3299028 RepID=A0ABW7FTD4_9BURK
MSRRAMRSASGLQIGLTLVELLIVVAIVAILAAVALPNYGQHVKKTRAQGAGADLAALALSLENQYQLQLAYPVYANATEATTENFPAWAPAQQAFFNYTVQSTASTYSLKAEGKDAMAGCTLTLNSSNVRSVSDSGKCGIASW